MSLPPINTLTRYTHVQWAALSDGIESASEQDLAILQAELSSCTAVTLELIEKMTLNQTRSSGLLMQIHKSFENYPPDFNSAQFTAYLTTVCRLFNRNILNKNEFEAVASRLISGAKFQNRPTELTTLYTLERCFLTTMAGSRLIDKLENAHVLDDAIANVIATSQAKMVYRDTAEKTLALLKHMEFPKSFEAMIKVSMNLDREDFVDAMLTDVLNSGDVKVCYLEAAIRTLDIDVLLRKCCEINFEIGSIYPAQVLINLFNEDLIHTDDILTRIDNSLHAGHLPHYLDIVGDIPFDAQKMPKLCAFVVENVERIYQSFGRFRADMRYSVAKVCSAAGHGVQVLGLEEAYWRNEIGLAGSDTDPKTLPELLDFMSGLSGYASEYNCSLHILGAIGLISVEPELRGVSRKVIKDFLNVIEISEDKKILMIKAFPQARGPLLEIEMGL